MVLAGSSGWNEGTITINQATTHANVFVAMPAESGATVIGADSVPAGKQALLKRFRVSMARANGSAGSADVKFMARPRGGAWTAERDFQITDARGPDYSEEGGGSLPPMCDWKFRCDDVSDNNTVIEVALEAKLIDLEGTIL